MKLVAKMAPALIFMLAVSTVTNAFSKENPVLLIKTSEGDIKVELFADKAPLSAKNFLAYAEAGFYEGTIFHRIIDGFMIQGSGFTKDMKKKRLLLRSRTKEATVWKTRSIRWPWLEQAIQIARPVSSLSIRLTTHFSIAPTLPTVLAMRFLAK